MKSRLFVARVGMTFLVALALVGCKKEPAVTPKAATPPAKTESSTDQAATIEAAEDGAITLKMANSAAMMPLKEEGIALTLDGKKAAFGDLKPGWTVLVHMDNAGDKVASIEAFTPEFARERVNH